MRIVEENTAPLTSNEHHSIKTVRIDILNQKIRLRNPAMHPHTSSGLVACDPHLMPAFRNLFLGHE
ncbi:hypothetical protein SDC9_196709 [bioreactor metagenome]|uniref:Uncharacterized protein n=1 Tax=bioreactor metagenome TaxID=1076179 RepID=A0A645IDV2_9ZZZZ